MKNDREPDAIQPGEFLRRRETVLKSLKGAGALVFAGEGEAPLLGKWRPNFHFYYLTGIDNEPGAAVLFNPKAENPKNRITLLLRPLNPERERWDGYRHPVSAALKTATGFDSVYRSDGLPAHLTGVAKRTRRLACLHPFSVYPSPVAPDLAAFRSVSERVLGTSIEDQTNLLPSLRALKSPTELNLMRRAVEITALGYAAACKFIKPGANELQISDALELTYRVHGASGVAYNSIVGTGLNGTILHYMDNSAVLKKGDLLVIDSGAMYKNYAADVTRTFPVGGKFGSEERDVYEIVLKSQLASIKAAKVGVSMVAVDEAARNVIEKAGLGDYFIHGIGHQLGLQVHDVTPEGPLKTGMVITIEPGVYLPDKKLGVRIEDDILIRRGAPENLSARVPKTVKDVEARFKR